MRNEVMIEFAIALPIALLVSFLIARIMLGMFGARLRIGLTALTIISAVGLSIGILLAALLIPDVRVWMLPTFLLAFGCSLALSFLVAGIATALHRGAGDVDVAKVLAAGESDRVEFKETARWNVREDKKDARMELAIAKTVAAFLNTGGGTLIIGANDAGEAVGLDRDLATLRVPDVDRFELWLRDLFSNLLGRNAAGLPHLQFGEAANGVTVCAVVCPRASKPVFLSQAKDGSSTDLWVRIGNSTRSLGVDEAVEYVARHWRPSVSSLLLGRPTAR
ncbi:helix-turn-helix domain-containing protein [Microbacterium fluvii]|uniref:Helix-turn-helix domain-containing protein n=1 Tax=Microbacterium fluvii TaxID=415215 RepID=A0ABW2H8J4_9MICO|nr:ATP-binding protein [Microbacterium fluvii]MCU4671042.1 ATP-binding protein [Microbacterium fluvii]